MAGVAFLAALIVSAFGRLGDAEQRAADLAREDARWLAATVADDMVLGDRSTAGRRAAHLLFDPGVVGAVVLDTEGHVFAVALSEDHPALVPDESWTRLSGSLESGGYVLNAEPVEAEGRVAGSVVVATQPVPAPLWDEMALLLALLAVVASLAWILSPRLAPLLRTRAAAPAPVEGLAKAKAQLLANTSHELRTPLNGIIGMTDVLLYTPLDDRQTEAVATIKRSSATLLALIDELLDFARVDAGKLELESESFDLLELVEDLASLHAPGAQRRGIRMIAHVDARIPERVVGDALRVRQVLTNLVGNALKFTESGEVFVAARLTEECDARLCIRFDVVDTGIGVAPEHLAHIFRSFHQGDGSTTRRYGGAGLGLAISRGLVELMDGTMGVDSKPGRGSRFWFEVPLDKDPEAERSAITRTVPAGRVLLADGCGRSRSVLRDYLDAWGLDVREASDSLAALTWLDRAEFDLVLLDRALTGGHAVARRARKCITLAPLTEADPSRNDMLALPIRRRQLRDRLAVALSEGEDLDELLTPVFEFELAAPRILVAEDDPTNQLVVGRMLESLGCEPVLVDDGRAAVECLREEQFDLVLLDCQMPGYDGLTVARIARGQLRLELPIVALTAHAVDGNKEACLAAGMNGFLAKPVTMDALAGVVDRWVGLPAVDLPAMSSK